MTFVQAQPMPWAFARLFSQQKRLEDADKLHVKLDDVFQQLQVLMHILDGAHCYFHFGTALLETAKCAF